MTIILNRLVAVCWLYRMSMKPLTLLALTVSLPRILSMTMHAFQDTLGLLSFRLPSSTHATDWSKQNWPELVLSFLWNLYRQSLVELTKGTTLVVKNDISIPDK